jgi:uncharacterized protein YndB with AHSA1/START domain
MIHRETLLCCSIDRAFELFTQRAGEWWPTERRHTGDAESTIVMLESGRFYERARDGREVELGRVRVWDPPHRLVLDWYPGTDRDRPTEVTVGFAAEGDKTRITIDHAPGLSGELWKQRNAKFDQSWTLVLAAFEKAAAGVR